MILKKNNKKNRFSLEIIISLIIHTILYAIIAYSKLNKSHVVTPIDNAKNLLDINTIMIDSNWSLQDNDLHIHQYKENTNFDKKCDETQLKIQKNLPERLNNHKTIETITNMTKINRKQTKDKNMKVKDAVYENERIKKMPKKAFSSKEKKGILEKKTSLINNNDFFKNLSANENMTKVNIHAKRNNSILFKKVYNENTNNISISDIEINSYANKLKEAIERHFYNASSYIGKTCTLKIKLASDGTLLNIQSEGGDYALCSAAMSAAQQAKIPEPPSKTIYELFKDTSLDFKP